MKLQKALEKLGVSAFSYEGESPVNEGEFLAGFRVIVDGEEIIPEVVPAAWADIEREIIALLMVEAGERLDLKHAELLRLVNGNDTREERSTWSVKHTAALMHLAGTATPAQSQTVALEAEAKGMRVDDLAQLIIQKSERFSLLIAMAAAVKSRARVKLSQIAADDLDLVQAQSAVKTLFEGLDDEIAASLERNKSETVPTTAG